MRLAGRERHAQRLAGPQQVLLADDLVDGARAQALRQRLPGTFRGSETANPPRWLYLLIRARGRGTARNVTV